MTEPHPPRLILIAAMRAALDKNNSNTTSLALVWEVPVVDSTRDRGCSVVEEIIVKLAVTCAKFQLVEEEGVVVQRESVEYIEFVLSKKRRSSQNHTNTKLGDRHGRE